MKKLSFLLALALMLSCLAACGTAPATDPDASPRPEVSDFEPIIVKSGESWSGDLNGDGAEDTVTCVPSPADDWSVKSLVVNGTDYASTLLTEQGFGVDNPVEGYYAIVDLDSSDSYKEIAISDFGPSSDLITSFFRYNGGLTYLGYVSGIIGDTEDTNDLSFNGDGTIASFFRLDVLQTWYADVVWSFTGTGFDIVPQELYYPRAEQEHPVTTLTDITLYTKNDTASEKRTVSDAVLSIVATDNAQWVLCRDDSGNDCWLHLDPDYPFRIDTPQGFVDGAEALDGLFYAD